MNIKQNIIFNIATICSFFLLGLDYISKNINNSVYKIIFNVFTVIIVFIIIISLLMHVYFLTKKQLSIKYKILNDNQLNKLNNDKAISITIQNNSSHSLYIKSIQTDKGNILTIDFDILPYSIDIFQLTIKKEIKIFYLYKYQNAQSRIKFFNIKI